jgi:hypothetical protein
MVDISNGRIGGHLAFLPADGFLLLRKRRFATITAAGSAPLSQEQDEGE